MASPVVVSRIQNRRGLQSQFNGSSAIYPLAYGGVGGYGSLPGFTAINYPNVLLPGEIALCTDSRRLFIGNLNGEFMELPLALPEADLSLLPFMAQLPPSPTFVSVPGAVYDTTPFTVMMYDVTDSLTINWNTPGTNLSRNGEMKITAVLPPFAPIPNLPFAPITPVVMSDSATEINTTAHAISFQAQYTDLAGSQIEIMYKHDFTTSLTFSSGTINWLPF